MPAEHDQEQVAQEMSPMCAADKVRRRGELHGHQQERKVKDVWKMFVRTRLEQ